MKPKYYPHVTLAAAIVLLLLPASLLVLIPSPESQSFDELIAVVEAERPAQVASSPGTKQSAAASSDEQRPPTRVAMLSSTSGESALALNAGNVDVEGSPVSKLTASNSQVAAMSYSAMLETADSGEPVRQSIRTEPEGLASSDKVALSLTDPGEEPAAPDDQLDNELEAALTQGSSTADSHYQSTGHLAMSGRIGKSNSAQPRAARSGKAKLTKRDGESMSEAMVSGTMPVVLDEDPFSSEPKTPIVDVIIQHPLERRPVNKVENLVAATQQPGWPIALVRSDLPDDVWWVQQMVGIRHRSFASRVNFGNDSSLPGSVYHLVIVFLDSADEARRFRIAKQFKELPEGLRRSREYTFVRK